MERFVERALVLSTVDYGDADRLVTLFTQGRGKLTAFAANARKSQRRFAGALMPFTLVDARLVERRGDTVRMDSADIQQGFMQVRGDLPRIARALYAVELGRELVRDHEPHPQLFEELVEYLTLLDRNEAGPTSLLAFELRALALAGLMPRFEPCSLCGAPPFDRPLFDPAHGGAVCGACRPRAPHGLAVQPEVLAALAAIQRGDRTVQPRDVRTRSRELLNVFIDHHLGRKLKSVDFMAQVGID
jgi:DNA repair protein RecO (recombination protein O)